MPNYIFSAVDKINFQGKRVALAGFESTTGKELHFELMKMGAIVSLSLSPLTNYLIVNEESEHETVKYKRALWLNSEGRNIKIISFETYKRVTGSKIVLTSDAEPIELVEVPDPVEIENKSNFTVGSGNIKFENSVFSTMGLTPKKRKEAEAIVLANGGKLAEPGKKTDYLIYSPVKAPIMKYWSDMKIAEAKGELYMLPLSVFKAWSIPDFDFSSLEIKSLMIVVDHFITHKKDWEPNDKYLVCEKLKRYYDTHVYEVLDMIYEDDDEDLRIYFIDLMYRVESHWVADGISDGFFIFSLLKKFADKALAVNDQAKAEFYIDYIITHYSFDFIDQADQAEWDNERGISTRPEAYYIIGRRVRCGKYLISDEEGAAPEELEWEILAQDGMKVLCLANFAIEAKAYNEEYENAIWRDSSIRKWLNTDFYENAFDDDEKERIVLSDIDNPGDSKYNTKNEDKTQDRVFLLSAPEVATYFETDEKRARNASPYAVKKGAKVDRYKNCWWWLRTPGLNTCYAAFVHNDGSIRPRGSRVNDKKRSVIPAIWMDISKTNLGTFLV